MDGLDEDEFGGSDWPDDQDLLQAATEAETQPPPVSHPSKRRRLDADSHGNAADDIADASDASDDFDPPAHPIPSGARSGSGFRQTTLFGGAAPTTGGILPPHQRAKVNPSRTTEPPTHHKLDEDALKTWVYPTNLGTIRDYQYNIVQKGLFNNLLVALPTGLGKTFIAATIMLNWFRWTREAQIVFVAPTKPLVAQQIDACFGIVGIPRSQTTMLTGTVSPGLRAEEWASKRVFFMTPQTMVNDLKTGICDPKKVVCLIVDEAHRATGGYAYVEIVQFIRRFNPSIRVVALTATPGSSVEAVQAVIDGLDIARVEIRTEDSLDIRPYVHARHVELVVFDPSEEMLLMKELFSKTLQPILDKLNTANGYWSKDPLALTAFGLTQARVQWANSDAGRKASMGLKGMMHQLFALLASLAHAIALLNYHGIGPFYQTLHAFRAEVEGEPGKGGKYRRQIVDHASFQRLMGLAQRWISDPEFIGHPKLTHVRQVVLNHFMDAAGGGDGEAPSATRIMIFVQYRDSAEEVVRVLKRHAPMIRPHAFVGQAGTKGSEGMNQKTQLDVIQKFQQGLYNTLVATCVGEEGLDIGEVDLILCYDSSASPIRMLQRMGRTGRKRAGNIVLLLMRGKEEDSYVKAKDGYEKMQQMIAAGTRFTFHEESSPRILPKAAQPVVDRRVIEIPIENTQGDLPEPRRRGKAPKRPAKKFHMPDGVQTGFVQASRIRHGAADGDESDEAERDDDDDHDAEPPIRRPPVAVERPTLDEVILSGIDEKELARRYQYVHGGDGTDTVSLPSLDAFPARQRILGPVSQIKHSRMTRRMVSMLNAMSGVDAGRLRGWRAHLHPDDEQLVTAERTAGPLRPDRGMAPDAWSSEGSSSSADGQGDVDGFVVGDASDADPTTSLTSSPLSADVSRTRFYISPKKRPWNDTDTDEDLPDVDALVEKSSSLGHREAPISDSEESLPSQVPPRRFRRPVLAESEGSEA